eukprot:45472-Eustigmatos_ZCMA.PRE.1
MTPSTTTKGIPSPLHLQINAFTDTDIPSTHLCPQYLELSTQQWSRTFPSSLRSEGSKTDRRTWRGRNREPEH